MLDILDLPSFLQQKGQKFENAKMICIVDKQIKLPSYLKNVYQNGSNIPTLVDIIGVDLGGRKYVVKGKVVVILGPRAFEKPKQGKRVLLLNGNFISRDSKNNYVEMTLIYNTNKGPSLYATRTLYREIYDIRQSYPEFGNIIEEISLNNWNVDSFFEANYQLPNGYRCCGEGYNFEDVDDQNLFVFRSDADFKRDNQNLNKENDQSVQNRNQQSLDKSQDVKYSVEEMRVITNRKPELKCRFDILPRPKTMEELDNLVEDLKDKVQEQIEVLQGLYVDNQELDDKLDYLYMQLKQYWRNTPSYEAATGRALFKNVLEYMYPEYKNKRRKGQHLIDYAIDSDNLLEIWKEGEIPSDLKEHSFFISVANLKEGLYLGILDYLLSLNHHLINAYNYSLGLDIDIFSVLKENPYYLTVVDNRLTVEDLDKLAMFFKINMQNSKVIKFRNGAYLHNYLMDSNNPDVEDNTIVPKKSVVKNVMSGYIISKKSYSNLTARGYILSNKVFDNIVSYLDKNITQNMFSLPMSGWKEKKVKGTSKYYLNMQSKNESQIVEDYLDLGLGIEKLFSGVNYLIDYNYILKEIYIMNRIYQLQEVGEKPQLNMNEVNKCIRAFERMKSLEWNIADFKLEERQADAVRNLHNPVLCITGPAGSGKTTTTEAILFVLQAMLGFEESDIMFCAPTGKAANRLKEIVKKPTRTIHSLFSIGGDSYTLMKEGKVDKKSEIKVLIIDECSMINLNLMYSLLSRVSDGTRVILLGDREQLPPIGPGKPFSSILNYAPCVVLNVLKRAAENSGITRNAQSLIYESDMANPPPLGNYDDFRILESSQENVVKLVMGIVNYHLGRAGEKRVGDTPAAKRVLQSLDVNLSPDDIQVITPVNKYNWGTKNLNRVLQDVFNPRDYKERCVRFAKGYDFETKVDENGNSMNVPVYTEYRINDRVIHLENMGVKEHFIKVAPNTYQYDKESMGVMNGDVGKIVDIVFGKKLSFVDENGNTDDEISESFSKEDNVMYIAVEYPGIDSKGNATEFIIFYEVNYMNTPENELYLRSKNVYTVESMDLMRLDLAYALTVHKLQGSQAKLIICVLFPVGFSDFISRNMIYTAITRAIKGLYLVGRVSGIHNAIATGRKIEQNIRRSTVTDKVI